MFQKLSIKHVYEQIFQFLEKCSSLWRWLKYLCINPTDKTVISVAGFQEQYLYVFNPVLQENLYSTSHTTE